MSSISFAALLFSGLLISLPDMDSTGADTDTVARKVLSSAMPDTKLSGQWQHSFEEAQRIAAEQHVPLIVHFEAVWCGPCRQMESSVLSKNEVSQQLATSFVGVRVNADQHSTLVSKYAVSSLPTEIILGHDGKELARFVGIADLDSYVARLEKLAERGDSQGSPLNSAVASAGHADNSAHKSQPSRVTDDQLRSCLIVQRDGKTVGLGGFSPVALTASKVWEKGSDNYVAAFQGVDYFFRSDAERLQFLDSPASFIPGLHGCDPVELSRENRAEAGAIEYGAFYKGRVFFFTSLQNREKFQSHPDWYADVISTDEVENSGRFPFLQTNSYE